MGAGQSDLYKGTYGDSIENIPDILKEKSVREIRRPTETDVREKYVNNIGKLTPKEMIDKIRADGYEVTPLSRGQFKGVEFEEGGGFKVLIGEDGIFQFHPGGKHHNDGSPYYKLSTGYSGTKRFDLKGNEIGE